MKWHYSCILIIPFLLSCSTSKWYLLQEQTKSINEVLDPLVENYGSTINPSDSLYRKTDSLALLLDRLALHAIKFQSPTRQDIIQQYSAAAKALLLLSKNPNLNLQAFASTLSELNKSRAGINSLLTRRRKLIK